MKKLLPTLLLIVCLCMGCGVKTDFIVDTDGAIQSTAKMYFTESEVEGMEQDMSQYTIETYNGETYFVKDMDEDEGADTEGLKFIITDSYAYLSLGESSGEDDDESEEFAQAFDFYDLIIHYPYEVVDSNGEIQDDNKSVKYDLLDSLYGSGFNGDTLWASFKEEDTPMIATEVHVNGVADGGIYNQNVTIEIEANGILEKLAFSKINSDGTLEPIKQNVNDDMNNTYQTESDGKYRLTYGPDSSDATVIEFIVDTTKPTTNIKNKKTYKVGQKITFKDATSGIKSAKLNNKTIKSGTKVTKAGKYKLVITDKAGNKKTVNFTVK